MLKKNNYRKIKSFFILLFFIFSFFGFTACTTAEKAPAYLTTKVISVSDGDTFKIVLFGKKERVRLIGVNTPEIAHPELKIKEQAYGKEAKQYTLKRLLGKKIWLAFDVQERDKYGRLLAYVWLTMPPKKNPEATMFNAELVKKGYAQVMTVPPNVKYADYFVKLQKEARKAKRGLWAK